MRYDVDREAVAILYSAAPGEPDRIPAAAARAFAALEAAIPPRGRKMYGFWYPAAREYYRRHDEVDLLVPVTG